MPIVEGSRKPTLLVLASTYPRWPEDPEPAFVHELCKRLTDTFRVIALVPDAPGADPSGVLDGVEVVRYRYAPRRLQTLVNDGGIVTNLRRRPWKFALVPGMVLVQTWHAWRLLRTLRVDVVHAHWLMPQGLIAALLRTLSSRAPPYLVTSHGADLFALRGRWFDSLKRFVVERAAAVTVVSHAMRAELARIGADADKVSVLPMGVDLTGRFTPDTSVARSPQEVLFVGRLVEKKGLRHLIDAMPAVLAAHPAARLTVAGFGPEEAQCRAQVQRLGLQQSVDFVGAVAQTKLPALYRRAAVFAAPFVQADSGDREGLGLVVVEAAGCGCPVIVSDLPAIRDVFRDCMPTALVLPGSVSALGEAINAALEPGAQRDATLLQVRASVRARFDWSVVADGYAGILRELIRVPAE